MALEPIGQPIEVTVKFGRRQIRPLQFAWKGQSYEITGIRRRQVKQEVLIRKWYFLVETQTSEIFLISFNTERLAWTLEGVQN